MLEPGSSTHKLSSEFRRPRYLVNGAVRNVLVINTRGESETAMMGGEQESLVNNGNLSTGENRELDREMDGRPTPNPGGIVFTRHHRFPTGERAGR